jgi:hypothetical protein
MGEALRQWGPAALAWVLVLTRARGGGALRRVLLGLACSLTAQVPAVYALAGQVTGVSHAARLISHAGMVFTAWAAQEFLARMNGLPRGPRWQPWWAAVAFGSMCVVFAALPDLLPQSPWVMEYCLVYAAAQAPALCAVVGLGLRQARRAQDRTIRVSLRLVVAGTALGLLYLLDKSVLAVAPRAGFEFPFGRSLLPAKILPTTAYVLVLVGAALPATLGWLHHYRLHRGLGPLWWALYRADPTIALDPPSVPDVMVLRHLRLRVYRRVIEIRDGLLVLQPYRCPAVATAARARAVATGLSGRALEAAVEAETVAAALRSRLTAAAPVPRSGPITGGVDLADDTAFLTQVSAVYRQSDKRLGRSGHLGSGSARDTVAGAVAWPDLSVTGAGTDD